jgi:hemolysin III
MIATVRSNAGIGMRDDRSLTRRVAQGANLSRARQLTARTSLLRGLALTDNDGRPLGFTWRYDRAEIFVDGIVHATGITLGVVGALVLLLHVSASASFSSLFSVLIYSGGLLAMLGLSAAYNLWPVSPVKWLLRRLDHAAIYLLIAATYTPFVMQLKNTNAATALLLGVWTTALIGMVMKLLMPGRFDRLAIALYLILGWSGIIVVDAIIAALPPLTLWLLLAGGLLYTAGVVFHLWHSLRFQNAIWHAFVLLAAACHYTAVFAGVG